MSTINTTPKPVRMSTPPINCFDILYIPVCDKYATILGLIVGDGTTLLCREITIFVGFDVTNGRSVLTINGFAVLTCLLVDLDVCSSVIKYYLSKYTPIIDVN